MKKIFLNTKYLIIIFTVLLSSVFKVFPQTEDKPVEHEFWLNAQAGASLGDQYLNVMASSLDVSYQIDGHWFSGVRGYLGGSNFKKNGSGTTIEDLGCMVGWFSQEKDFKLFTLAGVSYIHAQYFGKDYFYTVGVPFEAGVFYSPHQVGFGVSVHGNINGKIKYYGVTVGLIVRFY